MNVTYLNMFHIGIYKIYEENINIFMNVTYLNLFHIGIYKIYEDYDSITPYKGKFHIKYLYGARLHYS